MLIMLFVDFMQNRNFIQKVDPKRMILVHGQKDEMGRLMSALMLQYNHMPKQQRHFARRHVRLLCVLHGLQRCTAQGHLPPRRQGGAHPHAQRVLQTLAHAPVGRQGGAAPQRTEKRPGV